MEKKRKNLTFTQRLQIEALYTANKSIKIISEQLGLHFSTVYRELKRGYYKRLDGTTWDYIDSY